MSDGDHSVLQASVGKMKLGVRLIGVETMDACTYNNNKSKNYMS